MRKVGIQTILSAFGGGLFGAAIGALPAFIFTGFIGFDRHSCFG